MVSSQKVYSGPIIHLVFWGKCKSKPDEMPLYIDKNGYSLKNGAITIVDMAMEKLKLYGEIVRNKAV